MGESSSPFSPSLPPALLKDLILSFVDRALDPALHNYPGGRDVLFPPHNLVLFQRNHFVRLNTLEGE